MRAPRLAHTYDLKMATRAFYLKIARSKSCWVWTGCTTRKGYGVVRWHWPRTCNIVAHRLAWLLAGREIPDGMCVLHRCDNPPCCRIDHLFLGTRADNNADMKAKGRHGQTGEQNWKAKLTRGQVTEIRALYAANPVRGTMSALDRRFGLAPGGASHIIARRNWAWVP